MGSFQLFFAFYPLFFLHFSFLNSIFFHFFVFSVVSSFFYYLLSNLGSANSFSTFEHFFQPFLFDLDFLLCFRELSLQFFRLRGSLTKVIRASFLGSSTGKLPGAGIAGESHTRELFCNERRSARNTKQADVKLGASYDAHLPLFTIEAVEVGRRWRGWWIERDRWRRW